MWPFSGSLETSDSGETILDNQVLSLPDIPVANACHLAASGAIIPAWSLVQVHRGTALGGSISAPVEESARADGSPLQFDSDRSHRLKRLNKTSLYDTARL